MAETPVRQPTPAQKAFAARMLEKKRDSASTIRIVKDPAGNESIECHPVKVAMLNIPTEVKLRNKLVKELEELEKGELSVIFCHLTKAFLTLKTHIIEVVNASPAPYGVCVEIAGIAEIFQFLGAEPDEYQTQFKTPPTFGKLLEKEPHFFESVKLIKLNSINIKKDSVLLDLSKQGTDEEKWVEKVFVYGNYSFIIDDGVTQLPREIVSWFPENRILAPKAPNPTNKRKREDEVPALKVRKLNEVESSTQQDVTMEEGTPKNTITTKPQPPKRTRQPRVKKTNNVPPPQLQMKKAKSSKAAQAAEHLAKEEEEEKARQQQSTSHLQSYETLEEEDYYPPSPLLAQQPYSPTLCELFGFQGDGEEDSYFGDDTMLY
jgi:hypothetical protein